MLYLKRLRKRELRSGCWTRTVAAGASESGLFLASALFRKVAQELGDALDPYAAKGAKG